MLNNRCGMTLVEITIATIILSIVVLAAGTVYISGIREFNRMSDEARVQTEAAIVLDHIHKNLMGATGLETATFPSNDIVVLTNDPDLSPKIKYELATGVVKFNRFDTVTNSFKPENAIEIAENITALAFRRPFVSDPANPATDINNFVQISVTAEKGRRQRSFSTGVTLRGMFSVS